MSKKSKYSYKVDGLGTGKGLCSCAASGWTDKVGHYVVILEKHPGGKLLGRLQKEIHSLGMGKTKCTT